MRKKPETGLQSHRSQKLLVPFLITLIGSLLLFAAIFLPLASATGEHREYLQKYSDQMYAEELNMTNSAAVNISLLEYCRMYAFMAEQGVLKELAIICVVVNAAFALCAILTTLFAALKRPIAAIIFNLLSLGVFRLIKWDYEDRGVIGSGDYDWGAAQYACYIGVAVVMVGAVMLLVARIVEKRQNDAVNNV